jgi:hypothetical protein
VSDVLSYPDKNAPNRPDLPDLGSRRGRAGSATRYVEVRYEDVVDEAYARGAPFLLSTRARRLRRAVSRL